MFSYLSNSYAIQPVVSTAQPHTSDWMRTLIMLRLCNFMCAFFDAVLRRRTSRRCPNAPAGHAIASRPVRCRVGTSRASGSIPTSRKSQSKSGDCSASSQKFKLRSGNQSLAHGVKNVDKVARTSDLTHQRNLREHVHLLGIDIMNSPKLVVAAEFLPRGACLGRFRGMQQLLGAGIGQKIKFKTIEARSVGKTSHNLVRW